MGNLLTSLTGQFAKLVVLGTMFPVLIVSGLNLIFVATLFPFGAALQDQVKRIAFGDASWPVAAMTFTVFVLTGLLYNLNIPIIRIYEGYPWQQSWFGQWRSRRWKRQFNDAKLLRETLRTLGNGLRSVDPGNPTLADLSTERSRLGLVLNTELPDEEDLVLPTRLGNVIRSFEQYPYLAYGIDAIVIWPRLVAKIDPSFAATIDDAKVAFDFMLNCSLLTALTGCVITGLWLGQLGPLLTPPSLPWAWRAALFFGLAIVFYEWSIGAAGRWGVQVRAAFDLFRLDLLKPLGYQRQPATVHEERMMWQRIAARLLYPDSTTNVLGYKDVLTRVTASPRDIGLTAKKEYRASPGGLVTVTIKLHNDDRRTSATGVRVIETVPEGYKYLIETVTAVHGTVTVAELKPLELDLGTIQPNTSAIVQYTMRPTAM